MYLLEEDINENNEQNNETEVVENEQPAKEVNNEIPDVIDLKETNEKDYREIVEDYRANIFNSVKQAQKRSRISTIIMMICLIGAMVFLFTRNEDNSALFLAFGIALLVIALGVVVVTSVLNKRTNHIDTKKEYIIPATTAINRFVFDGEDFSEATYKPEEKIELGTIYEDNVYTGVTDCVSRNIIHGKFHGKDFMVGELGLYVGPRSRQRKTTFIGKYLTVDNSLHFKGQYVLLLKGENEMDVPVLPEDYEAVVNEDRFLIYEKDDGNYKKDLSKDFVDSIKNMAIKDNLLNVAVYVTAGKTVFYLSFDDPVTTLPFYDKLNDAAIDEYRSILLHVLSGAESLDK